MADKQGLQEPSPCAVCGKLHRRYGPWCAQHEKRHQRTGSPTGQLVLHKDLDLYRPQVATMLNRWATDPAIVAGLELMEDILQNHGRDSDAATVGRRARPYLDRLMQAGGDARSSLIEMVSLAFYWSTHGGGWPSPAEQDMAFATRLLLHKRTGQRKNAWRRRVIAALGGRIRSDLSRLLVDMYVVWKRTEDTRAARRKTAAGFAG